MTEDQWGFVIENAVLLDLASGEGECLSLIVRDGDVVHRSLL